MIHSILCTTGTLKNRYFNVHDVVSLGSSWTADIRLPARDAAALHCCLATDPDGTLVLIDLATAKGTQVEGERITRCPLQPGDRFQIGTCEFVVQSPDDLAEEATMKHGASYTSRPPRIDEV